MLDLWVDGSSFTDSVGRDAILLDARDTAVLRASIGVTSGNTIDSPDGSGIKLESDDASTVSLTLRATTIRNITAPSA